MLFRSVHFAGDQNVAGGEGGRGFHGEDEERAVEGVDGGADAEGLVADDLVELGEQFTLELRVGNKQASQAEQAQLAGL